MISKLLNVGIDVSDPEIMIHFPISLFQKIAEIVPYIKKRSSKTSSTDQERERVSHLRSYRTDIMRQNDARTGTKDMRGANTLDAYNENERETHND